MNGQPYIDHYRTHWLDPGDRFADWAEKSLQSRLSSWASTEATSDFPARTSIAELGGIRVSSLVSPPLRLDRTLRLIRQDDPEIYHLTLVQKGAVRVIHKDRMAELSEDQFVLVDSSLPFRRWRSSADGFTRATCLEVPKRLLDAQVPRVEELVAMPFSARTGSAALLGRLLGDLLEQAGKLTPTEREDLARLTIDMLGTVCTRQLGGGSTIARPPDRNVLMTQILDFVRQNLADPGLSPDTIAVTHHISIRHLHSLFEQDGRWTVAQLIRHLRLDRCRAELADPRQTARPIAALAARWGFLNPAHFSRVFRAEFGMAPRAYRHAALEGE